MTENFLLSNRFLSKHNRNRDRLFIQPKSGTAIAFYKNTTRTAIAFCQSKIEKMIAFYKTRIRNGDRICRFGSCCNRWNGVESF
jgi:hypothetical protein